MDNCSRRRRPEYIANRISDPSYLRIFDTTLRDGDQSPGTALTRMEKLEIARELAKLKVDTIEAGFPVASKSEFEAVKSIAEEVGNNVDDEDGYVPVIGAVGRCNEEDIRLAWEAVKYAKRPRIITFLATSQIHMQHKLRMSKEQVVEIAVNTVKFARSLGCHDVQFSAEDACRSERDFLYHIFGEVIKAGATTVCICDTVGIMFPSEIAELVSDVKANTPGIQNVILSVHCHDDLGLATANALAVIPISHTCSFMVPDHTGGIWGARQVDVTINGIGERAGNSSLEEVVMAIKCRGNSILEGIYTGINSTNIIKTSKMVEEYSGMQVQPHKAIVGANAFAHQSGIHQDAMLKNKSTYEIMCPKDIGLERSNDTGIILGKLSGRHALKVRFRELGYELTGEQFDTIFLRFKAIAEQKKVVTDVDLKALVSEVV